MVHFRPVQRAGGGGGGGGCCPFSADSTSGGGGGGGGVAVRCVQKKESQYRLTVAVSEKFSALASLTQDYAGILFIAKNHLKV